MMKKLHWTASELTIHSLIDIFESFQFHYLPAYGLQFGMLFQIFINCLLGHFVDMAVGLNFFWINMIALFLLNNRTKQISWQYVESTVDVFQHDQIYDAILQLDFYAFPIKEQHFYRFYIMRCQDPTLLTFGGFAPLNLETSVQVNALDQRLLRIFQMIHWSIWVFFSQIYSKIYSYTMLIYTMVTE